MRRCRKCSELIKGTFTRDPLRPEWVYHYYCYEAKKKAFAALTRLMEIAVAVLWETLLSSLPESGYDSGRAEKALSRGLSNHNFVLLLSPPPTMEIQMSEPIANTTTIVAVLPPNSCAHCTLMLSPGNCYMLVQDGRKLHIGCYRGLCDGNPTFKFKCQVRTWTKANGH